MTRHERWNVLLELLADAGRPSVEEASEPEPAAFAEAGVRVMRA
ncbi:hypothetical protein AB0C21_25995 [Spirillospora sp. NPDC049024]